MNKLYRVTYCANLEYINAENVKEAFNTFCKEHYIEAQILKIKENNNDFCLWANSKNKKRIYIELA